MSMKAFKAFESGILREAKEFFCNKKLRLKDIMEWSTGKIKPLDGEIVVYLPVCRVYVSIQGKLDQRAK